MFTKNSALLSTLISKIITDSSVNIGSSFNQSFNSVMRKLFANGEQGFVYDPNDLSTLYQDAAGTIPVTSVGQPVGLVLDKSKGLVLGEELASVTEVVSLPIDAVGGVKTYLIGAVDIGKTYQISFTVSNFTGSGDVGIAGPTTQWLDGTSVSISSNGTKRCIRTKFTTREVYLYTRNTAACVFSNISIKEIKGHHAYQTTSASRPILKQTPILAPNLLTTYDFRTWVVTGAPNPLTANSFTTAASGGVRVDILKPNTSYMLELDIENTSTVNVYHGSGANTAVASGTRRKVLIQTTTDNGTYFYFRNAAAGTTTVHSIKVQEVVGYRTDQNYLEFDGTDDFLQTNNIDFTATDKVSLFAGVRKLSDTATGTVLELSPSKNTNTGVFSLFAPLDSGAAQIAWVSKGTTERATSTVAAAPVSTVISAKGNISGRVSQLRIDGVTNANNAGSQGTGNFGNYPLYIGRRGGESLPFNGHLYGLIGVGKLVSNNETASIEKELAKRVGVTLNV